MGRHASRCVTILLSAVLVMTALWDFRTDQSRVRMTPQADWLAAVQDSISRAEYEVTWQNRTYLPGVAAAYQAPNRAHNLRAYFTPDAIRLIPRIFTGQLPDWEWGLQLVGFGFEGELRPVAAATLSVQGNRIEYRRGSITEWYLNTPEGLEQGFTLAAPPAGRTAERFIVLALRLTGTLRAAAAPDGQTLELTTTAGVRVLQYDRLRVTDASGRSLPSRIVVGASLLSLRVDATSATYPVVIDPLTSAPIWTVESNQSYSGFGEAVLFPPLSGHNPTTSPGMGTAGDVNGDSYGDVIIGAATYDTGEVDKGRVFVYHGSSTGLGTTPAWTVDGPQSSASFGGAVSTAGDVNGDGYSDVIVGAPNYTGVVMGSREDREGAVFVYHGSASGLSLVANRMVESNRWHGGLGWSVASAGDVNGDGYADVISGAPYFDPSSSDPKGRLFVFHGSASGLSLTPSWTVDGDRGGAEFGETVALAGDVNGDGYSDVIVGAPNYADQGRAIAYYGSASGLSTSPNWILDNPQDKARFGESVSTAGDVNGDGYADVIVGAPFFNKGSSQTDEGRAFVYYGSAGGLGLSAGWVVTADQVGAHFGSSVSTAGDVNGDGYADVIVAANTFDAGQQDEGRVFVYLGSAGGLNTIAAWTAESNQAGAQFGSVATAGDVNGDGYADVIVGDTRYDNGQVDEGRVFVYRGSAGGLSVNTGWTMESNQSGAQFGYAVATAGDVNGDGYADVVVGAPAYDNGQTDEGRVFVYQGSATGPAAGASWSAEGNQPGARFGTSVGSAGDVNGDGYADLIIGAPFYDNGQTDEGRVFVYHGSVSGLKTTVNWRAEGNQAGAQFGAAVATAGDVNGDGYADVLVGAPLFSNGQPSEGRTFMYRGSASGLGLSPAWTAESNQSNAGFGSSAGTAGDVNRDGYSDVIVGAPLYDSGQSNEGRAFVYLGSAAGLSAGASWMAESNQLDARFGSTVGTAGDVNGDGYSDVTVGAPLYDSGQLDEGKVFVYHGAASGLSAVPTWTREGNQVGAQFGQSVATAGDVNGDGYADVIVGAPLYDSNPPNEGWAFVHHGSASGLISKPAWTAESNQTGAQFGQSVIAAGDVNGDGYADVIVGALAYDNGQTDEGRVFLYYGNEGRGVSLRPRQRRTDNSGPIAHLGKANSSTAFGLALQGRTPFGRGKVKLEVEVKPLSVPFNGLGTIQTLTWQDTAVAGVDLFRLVSGFSAATPYHWRVRVLYHSAQIPFQQHGRWLTMPWNGWNEKDLRTF